MNKRIVRLDMGSAENLYRFSEDLTASGFPRVVEAFQKDPAARRVLGRWTPCPNFSVACRIKHAHLGHVHTQVAA